MRPSLLIVPSLIVFGLASTALAEGPANLPAELKDWDFTDDGIRVVLDGDLLRERLRSEASEAVRGAVPAQFSEVTIPAFSPLKYRNIRLAVDRIELLPGHDDREIRWRAVGGLDADRARWRVHTQRSGRFGLHVNVTAGFEPDGNARLAGLQAEGRLQLAVTAAGDCSVVAPADTLRIDNHVVPALSGPVSLNGRHLFARDWPLTRLVGSGASSGLRVAGIRVVDAAARDPVFELLIRVEDPVPPAAPPAVDGGGQ